MDIMIDSTNYVMVGAGAVFAGGTGVASIMISALLDPARRKVRATAFSSGLAAVLIAIVAIISNPFASSGELHEDWLAEKYGVVLLEEAGAVGYLTAGDTVEVVSADGDVFLVEKQGTDESPVLVNVVTGEELADTDEGIG